MMIGIASGTYSSIFIASPVLTAWKEREPGYVRRRQRIAEVEGGLVPAFVDDIQASKLADDDETEAEIADDIEREAPAAEAPAGSRRRFGGGRVAEAEAPEVAPEAPSAPEDDTAPAPARSGNGASANPESAERRKRNEERRAKRAQRRKGKRR
jgi:SecD/SecF fusion protein